MEGATQEVLWLSRVLAGRGMPRLLLERHLATLADELDAVRPEDGERWAVLREVSQMLTERRHAVQSEETLEGLDRSFDAAVRGSGNADAVSAADRLPRMGALLAAAVADERDGVANSVDSLLAWAGDPERFSQAWIDAVNETLAQARAHD